MSVSHAARAARVKKVHAHKAKHVKKVHAKKVHKAKATTHAHATPKHA